MNPRQGALADFRQQEQSNQGLLIRRRVYRVIRMATCQQVHRALSGIDRHLEFFPLHPVSHLGRGSEAVHNVR
jgi:hypothetical protein